MNIDEEIQNAKDDIDASRSALLASGITAAQMEQLGRFVYASIALIQYGTLKAAQDTKNESAFQPGSFQTKIL